MHHLSRVLVRVAVGGGLLAGLGILAENIALNVTLPYLLGRHPDRLAITYRRAWMVVPGRLHVRDLEIAASGDRDRVVIRAERAFGVVDLPALFSRRFHATGVLATGVQVSYRTLPGDAAHSRAPGATWTLQLDDVTIDDLEDVRVGDQHFFGEARATAALTLAGTFLDLDAEVILIRVSADVDASPVARGLHGDLTLLVDGLDRTYADEALESVSARARVAGDVEDLRFVDFYLEAVPWLSLAGRGEVAFDLGVEQGRFRVGSVLQATFPELLVRYLHNDVTGAGSLRAAVVEDGLGAPMTRLVVAFDDFAITPDGSTGALVEGLGFRVTLTSPDAVLQGPFTSVDVVLDLPTSRVPDITMFGVYLPRDVGLGLVSGTATVRGRMVTSTVDDHAHGELFVDGDEWIVGFEPFTATFDVHLHARLVDTRVGTGIYDISGTALELRDVGLVSSSNERSRDGERAWRAELTVPSGRVRAGRPVYVDAVVDLRATDSYPFVAVFVDRARLPAWVRAPLHVSNVVGTARVQVGADTLQFDPCEIVAGRYRLDLRYRRERGQVAGDLYTRAGTLSLGIGLSDGVAVWQLGAGPLDHRLPIGATARNVRR